MQSECLVVRCTLIGKEAGREGRGLLRRGKDFLLASRNYDVENPTIPGERTPIESAVSSVCVEASHFCGESVWHPVEHILQH